MVSRRSFVAGAGAAAAAVATDISRTWVFGDPSPRQRKVLVHGDETPLARSLGEPI
jgi:hypothetical protein